MGAARPMGYLFGAHLLLFDSPAPGSFSACLPYDSSNSTGGLHFFFLSLFHELIQCEVIGHVVRTGLRSGEGHREAIMGGDFFCHCDTVAVSQNGSLSLPVRVSLRLWIWVLEKKLGQPLRSPRNTLRC